ncbi:MAG TPA: sugar phosphate isomerase/epimerase [Bryobacteraceae bacterium]|nr:sugar phosphate isomerase/epimerase [Bryobacteraceae bacterium]
MTRRSAVGTLLGAAILSAQSARIPVGLELYSVRDELKVDLMGTVRKVAGMGYQCVEFYSPYFDWSPEYAKEVRKLLDDLGITCPSTHNGAASFRAENLQKAIELNQILGSRHIVMASAGRVQGLDGWKRVAETLNQAAEKTKPHKISTGFHNHREEFVPIEGKRPMDVLAENTGAGVGLQLDVGTCVHAGQDPVEWINKVAGRIPSMHLKDWGPGPDKGYRVLFGEGASPWKQIFDAAEKKGGIEFYLIEQEGSALPAMETAQRCLETFKKMRS